MEETISNYMKAVQFAFRQALLKRWPLQELRYRLRARPQPAAAVRKEVCSFLAIAPDNPYLTWDVVKWILSTDMEEVSDYTLLGIASTEPTQGTNPKAIGWG